ncbi:Permease [Sphingomonas antarctica]|uniref:CBU_0592 family membrane protein n=1 Tax=Sphingomonas antarctica TaxID=2040274 RepID=UPI0039EB2F87
MTFDWADWTGLIGSAMFIIGFVYANISKDMDKVAFNLLNIIGAVLLLVSLTVHFNLAAVVLETVWALIATGGLIGEIVRRRSA